jgi:hypothetical protein
MTNNPYAPPVANVEDIESNDVPTPFFVVSTTKFVVMWICTASFYMIYWFYKHWKSIKQREMSNINPAARSIFSVFFVYSLFKNIRDEANRVEVKSVANVGMCAIGWILFNILGGISAAFFLLSFLSVLFAVPVQACANRINQHVAPDHDPNSTFTGWNIVLIVVGSILVVLAMIGIMLPEE